MGDTASHIRQARQWFSSLQTRDFSSADDMQRTEEYMLKDLKEAGLTIKALDPDGKLGDSAMAQQVKETIAAACLRSARKRMQEFETTTTPHDGGMSDYFVSGIRALLQKGGFTLADLDPAEQGGAAAIEARFKAGARRFYLQKARHDFEELETSTCAAWGDMTEGMIRRMREDTAKAGAKLSALDADGNSTDADIEKRIAKAEARLQIMYMNAQLKEAETAASCYSPDGAFRARENIAKTVEKLRQAPAGLGPEIAEAVAQFTTPLMDSMLAAAEKQLCKLGAERVLGEMQKELDGTEKGYKGSMQYKMRDLDAYLAHIGGMEGFAPAGSAAAARYSDTISKACLRAGADELEDFEKMSAPKTLREIDDRAERIATLFNRAGAFKTLGDITGDNPALQMQQRMDEAGSRARDLYYAAGGKLPVMKRIRLAVPQGQGGGA